MRWEWIVVVYTAYFAIVAWSRGYSAALKYGTVAALISASVLALLPAPIQTWQIAVRHWLPLVVLLAGYRLSGLFFVAPRRGRLASSKRSWPQTRGTRRRIGRRSAG